MPTYQYKCEECGVAFERFQHFSEEPVKTCPECEGAVRRVIQPVGIIFKGSGFYVTDNKRNGALTSKVETKTDGEDKPAAPAKSEETGEKPASKG